RELAVSGPVAERCGGPPGPGLLKPRSVQTGGGGGSAATVRSWSAGSAVSAFVAPLGQVTRSSSTLVALPSPQCAASWLRLRKLLPPLMRVICVTPPAVTCTVAPHPSGGSAGSAELSRRTSR